MEQLEELLEWAYPVLADRPLRGDDLGQITLFQLTGAAHRLARGIAAQVRGGATDGMDGMVRSLVEALINVKYILADDTEFRAMSFQVDDIRSRRALCNRMIPLFKKGRAPSMAGLTTIDFWKRQEAKLAKELADIEEKYGKDKVEWPKRIEDRAKLGDSEELYATAFWLFSHDEHLTARGLNRFTSEKDGALHFSLEHHLGRLESFLGMVYVYYVAFLNIYKERLSFPEGTELEKYDLIAQQITGSLRPNHSSQGVV